MRTVFEKTDVIPLVAEVFRELGYEGTSLSQITARTGLGKGSLYHFFPGGKEEMATAVLAHVDAWFEDNVYRPLGQDEPHTAMTGMWTACGGYFRSGHRICLLGAFALDETRDRFATEIQSYFTRWIAALEQALIKQGMDKPLAKDRAEEAVAGIQGALVLARALNDAAVFARAIERLSSTLDAEISALPSAHPIRRKTSPGKSDAGQNQA